MPLDEKPDFDLFTSFRYDPKLLTADFNNDANDVPLPYLLFPYHVQRLAEASRKFGWPKAIETIISPSAAEDLKLKCDRAISECNLPEKENGIGMRVRLTHDGELIVETNPTRPFEREPLQAVFFKPNSDDVPPPPVLDIYIDTKVTPSSVFTSYKTTARAHYSDARKRAGIKDRKELKDVLLYNENDEITESSVANVAFWRDDAWTFPPDSSGGLRGTMRRYLIEHGLGREGIIRKSDVQVGEWVLLTNGWIVSQIGKVVGPADQ